jgi:D-alanyl-D-alanine dipeptidase
LKYSTTDNFVGADVYGALKNCYLQPEVTQMLAQAHAYLRADFSEYRFLVYDGVRPLQVQQILWDTLDVPMKDKPKYVSDPKKGSIHNYGAAVDLTLADAAGNPLDMGTAYDHFGYLAYPIHEEALLNSGELSSEQVQNRRILRGVMEKAGFSPITSEWWHFNAFSRKEADKRYEMIQ